MSLQMSSSQTIGPYLHIGTDWLNTTEMAGPEVQGERIGRAVMASANEAVLVDLSRNSSKRYCDTGNCGNRVHVAAYRARLRSVEGGGTPADEG